jgi:hypothetical protein
VEMDIGWGMGRPGTGLTPSRGCRKIPPPNLLPGGGGGDKFRKAGSHETGGVLGTNPVDPDKVSGLPSGEVVRRLEDVLSVISSRHRLEIALKLESAMLRSPAKAAETAECACAADISLIDCCMSELQISFRINGEFSNSRISASTANSSL